MVNFKSFCRIIVVNLLIIAAAVLVLFFAFYRINRIDLQFWDEATNMAVIAETSQRSDFWNLHFNGEYFWEKPPLFYWLGIGLQKIFNFNSSQFVLLIRSISAVFAGSTIFLIYLYLRRIKNKNAGILSILFFLTIPFLWFFSPGGTFATHNFRSADSDSMQLFFIVAGSLLALELPQKIKLNKKFFIRVFLICLFSGLAVMTKGIFGLVPVVVANVLLVINFVSQKIKHTQKLKYLFIICAFELLILFLLIAPWHIFMVVHFGKDFIDEYFIYHQLGRAGSSLEGHIQPIYFYLKFLFDPHSSGILIWVGVTLILQIFFKKLKLSELKELIIAGILLLFFSLIATKISWYVLITIPFFVIYLARAWDDIFIINKYYLKQLFLFLITIQIIFNLFNLFTLPVSIQQKIIKTNRDKQIIFLTNREPHRVFLYMKLMNEGEVINTADPILTCKFNTSGKTNHRVEFIIDRQEYRKEILFKKQFSTKKFSSNYRILEKCE